MNFMCKASSSILKAGEAENAREKKKKEILYKILKDPISVCA